VAEGIIKNKEYISKTEAALTKQIENYKAELDTFQQQ